MYLWHKPRQLCGTKCNKPVSQREDAMNGLIKIEAKSLLLGKTAKCFIASFTVFLIEAALAAAAIFGIYALTEREFFKNFTEAVGGPGANLTVIAALAVIRFAVLVTIFALHLGEFAFYTEICENRKPEFSKLFSFCKPKKAFKAFRLYAALFALKTAWFLFFITPAALCAVSAFFTVYRDGIFNTQANIMTLAAVILTVIGIMFCYCITRRYELCSYLAVKNTEMKNRDIIRQSTVLCDGILADGALFGFSMAGWRLLSLLPFSFVYALPYCKITYARYFACGFIRQAYKGEQAAEFRRHFPPQAAAQAKE